MYWFISSVMNKLLSAEPAIVAMLWLAVEPTAYLSALTDLLPLEVHDPNWNDLYR